MTMTTTIVTVKLDDLLPNPYQPEGRLVADDDTRRLTADMLSHGQQVPLIVRRSPSDGKYEVADGWQRVLAARELAPANRRFAELRAELRDITDQEMARIVPSSNTHRPLSAIDLARYYKRYMAEFHISQTDLAKERGCSQGEISNTIRLLELPEDIQQKVISHDISEAHGRYLLQVNSLPQVQQKLIKAIQEDKMPVSELDRQIKRTMWERTKPLYLNGGWQSGDDPLFELAQCQACEHRLMVKNPWGQEDKPRCDDAACWNKKQREFLNTRKQADLDKLARKGILKIYLAGELPPQKYDYLPEGGTPEECNSCPKRGGRYNEYNKNHLEIVCLDPKCHKDKENSIREKEKQELQAEHEKAEEKVNNIFNAVITDHAATLFATMECFLRTGVPYYRNDDFSPILQRLADAFDLYQKGDRQAPTVKSILAQLKTRPPDTVREYILPRLAFEMYREIEHDDKQVNAILDLFYSARMTVDSPNKKDAELAEADANGSKPEENIIYVDRETLEELGASNSCEAICEGTSVRPTVTVNDELYLATGALSSGSDGMIEVQAYKVASISPDGECPNGYPDVKLRTYQIPYGREYEEYYESLRNDPMGFYHGMVVKKARGKWVLIGPEITFRLESEAKQERAEEFEGEQELLSFQFLNCDGCHWADREKVGSGNPCCTFITRPQIVDGKCLTRSAKASRQNITDGSPDPLASFQLKVPGHGRKEEYVVTLRGADYAGATLRKVVLMALDAPDEEAARAMLESYPESENKRLILAIMENETPK
ncbi:MAG: hypothetical protein A2Z70_01275 [Chloroflexi bacterium RBG_13_48_17]|nr:MAG: hypothetical protein A2Z70_01275 [Chloroflexi bacterium RBG_13_48_17]